jgi:hypothetical protein
MDKIIPTTSIHVKHSEMVAEYYRLKPRMQAVVLYVNNLCVEYLGFIPIWTSFYRPKARRGKPSVHNYFRGGDMSDRVIDLRGAIGSRRITKQEIKIILTTVNQVFPYGKGSINTAIHHKTKRGALHFHYQVKEV